MKVKGMILDYNYDDYLTQAFRYAIETEDRPFFDELEFIQDTREKNAN